MSQARNANSVAPNQSAPCHTCQSRKRCLRAEASSTLIPVCSRRRLSVFICGLCFLAACKSASPPKPHAQIGWRPITSFSGRGDTQTESFDIASTQWRIKWQTKGAEAPGAGSFHVVVHSAVSGRPILDAIQQHGDGYGIAYVNDDPRLYELVIESTGLDWSVAVEEAVVGIPQ